MSEMIPLPKDPRHQRFADFYLGGMSGPEAYRAAKLKVGTAGSVRTMASRLLKKVDVVAYIEAVRQKTATATVMTAIEKREFLARVVRVPLMSINPNDSDYKDGDLITKYKRTVSVRGEGEETIVNEEIVKLDPMKAIAEDNKLSGDDPEANALQQMAEEFARLGSRLGPLPEDKM